MRNRITFLLLFLFSGYILFVAGCKDKITNPPEENPPGYQEDIPWPSLADSPWPAIHSDMQRTGRSKYVGPQQGIISAKVRAVQMQTGIVFADDSIFYFGQSSRFADTTKLVAAKTDGSIIWSLDLNAFETSTTPLIDNNGTIYISNGDILAVNPNGTVKWTYQTEGAVHNRGIGIGKDGNIYAIENGSTLIALSQNGNLLWKVQNQEFPWGTSVQIAFSPDGRTLYFNGNNITLIAFDLSNKSIRWKFGHKYLENGPVIDSKGNIYLFVADDTVDQNYGNFYCLDPNGNIKWTYSHPKGDMYYLTDPTIDKEGNLYFATDTLYALNYSGQLKWKLGLYGINYSPLICDAEGNIYVAANKEFYDSRIYSISKDGKIKWIISITDILATGDCPAITQNGILVYPSWKSQNLIIIK